MNSRIEKKTPTKALQRAIVIGGSLAGMLAARVLLDHYDEVTILESDRYPGHAGSRSGIPKSKHGAADLKTRLMHRYMDQVIRLTTSDRKISLAFLKVMHMLDSPATLFAPSVLMQVARQAAGWPQPSAIRTANEQFELGNGVP